MDMCFTCGRVQVVVWMALVPEHDKLAYRKKVDFVVWRIRGWRIVLAQVRVGLLLGGRKYFRCVVGAAAQPIATQGRSYKYCVIFEYWSWQVAVGMARASPVFASELAPTGVVMASGHWALASASCSSAKAMNICRSSTSSLIWAMKAEKARLAARRRMSLAQAGT
ncbi:hypothetical protein D3C76_424960 [compost metagenome]